MGKRNVGQFILIIGVLMIVLSGVSVWLNWFGSGLSAAIFVIALILAGAGTYISKRGK